MPEMDGITLLKKLVPLYKIPCIMMSALNTDESDIVLKALEIGAVDYVKKPELAELNDMTATIIDKIKTAASANIELKPSKDSPRAPSRSAVNTTAVDTSLLVAIGASTGGIQALHLILTALPESIPPILIVQHIPPVFSEAFAKRMQTFCPFLVKQAHDRESVEAGKVLIAPGGRQMRLDRLSGKYRVLVDDGPAVNRHKPSVDVLFDSVADITGKKSIGIILTGMGIDGAKGLLRMKEQGAQTIAQDEASSVVFGMPREAIRIGAAGKVLPIDDIPKAIMEFCERKRTAA
jgi:two-component system chemotaxis response regulator CheB